MKASTTHSKTLKTAAAAAFWLGVWYLVAVIINKEIFLPYPHTVAVRFCELSATADFWKTVFASVLRILGGFSAGAVLGTALAVLTHRFTAAETLFAPAVAAIRATPVVSFILLAYLWLDNDTIPVVIALLMILPVMWQNTSAGLSALDRNLSEMAKVFSLSPQKRVFRVILPQLYPYLYSGLLSSLGLAFKSGIAAEVISYPRIAIGKEMNDAKVILETADVLVWTVAILLLSLAAEGLFKLLFKGGKRV